MQNKTKFKESKIGMIPEVWEVVSFKEILGEKGYIRGPFGSALRRPELKTEGIAVYEQEHAIYNSRNFRYYLDEKKFEELSRFQVKENDLIISCSGTLGKASIISNDDPKGIISQALLILRPDASKIRPLFLKYFIDSPRGFDSLVSRSTGSVQVNIAKREIIEGILLSLPELREQDVIVKFISDIDLKIEINQQMNKNVEAIGEALFKHWFIDFEFPNGKGKPYKSSGGEMVDSELGEMPKGWDVRPFSEVIAVSPRRQLTKGSVVKKVGMADLERWQSWITSWSREEYKGGSVFKNGDTLFAKITPCLEQGKTAFLSFLDDEEVAFGSTEFIVLSPKVIKSPAFIFFLSRSTNLRDEAIMSMTGTSGRQRVPNEFFDKYLIVCPPHRLIDTFDKLVRPMMVMINNNAFELASLGAIRDSLLPKLMSGQIRVPAG